LAGKNPHGKKGAQQKNATKRLKKKAYMRKRNSKKENLLDDSEADVGVSDIGTPSDLGCLLPGKEKTGKGGEKEKKALCLGGKGGYYPLSRCSTASCKEKSVEGGGHKTIAT